MERDEILAIAKEIGQEIGQTLSQTIQTFLQATGASTAGSTVEGRVDDIGGDETLEKEMIDETGVRSLNRKRTYDAYLAHHLESIGRDRGQYDTEKMAAHQHTLAVWQMSEQSLQNAITTADMVAKNALQSNQVTSNQTIDHRDLSYDKQINVDEQVWAVESILRNPVFKDALMVLVVEAVKAANNADA